MKQLFTRLFSVPDGPRSSGRVISWWELRRVPYNIIVGAVGIINLLVFALINDILLKPYVSFDDRDWEPLSALVFVLLVNVLFTGGWICELLIRVTIGREVRKFGPAAYGFVLIFTLILTFLPPLLDGIQIGRAHV